MTKDSFDKRNFLFFLNDVYPMRNSDALSGIFTSPTTWDAVAEMVNKARKNDPLARSVKKLQLYVHVLFCARLCTFCCTTHVLLKQRSEIDAYIKALTRQMMLFSPVYKGMDADQISFGGGTPSILTEQQLTVILDAVDKAFPNNGRKIFFEAHPSSWTASKLEVLSSRGLYRLSIGIQSLEKNVLKLVSRSQTKEKISWCLRSARKAGVPQLNVDLIAGLPGQTIRGFIKDLKFAIDEGVNTVGLEPYHTGELTEMCGPGEMIPEFIKRRDDMMKAAAQVLPNAGFHRKGIFGVYTRNQEPDQRHEEEAYLHLEEAIAGFGPFARGQFPGAVFYRTGGLKPTGDLPDVRASVQDYSSAMSNYAVFALIYGLDERVFLKRFGVSLDLHCGEGLRYLKKSGLVSFSKGIWKFSGELTIRRFHELVALSKVLYGEEILSLLRTRYLDKYDPKHDYSKGSSLLKAYAVNSFINWYYRLIY